MHRLRSLGITFSEGFAVPAFAGMTVLLKPSTSLLIVVPMLIAVSDSVYSPTRPLP
jgi:hypothetical protein